MDSEAQMARRQAEMVKDLSDHPGFFDGGDDFQFTATVGTVMKIDIEHPFQQSSPADSDRSRWMEGYRPLTLNPVKAVSYRVAEVCFKRPWQSKHPGAPDQQFFVGAKPRRFEGDRQLG